uniref:Uncharacterized protein n=1 Tax=Panagrolaimus sp. PS1159 TaxID=55785 RepID=A0AC35GL95_9BILA
MSEVEKIRSAEKEADLDRKIQEIRLRNEQLEERHKIVTEEAKQNGVPKSFQKATVNNGGGQHKSGSNHTNLKTSETIPSAKKGNGIGELKGNQWSREWDRGKTSAEDWKMNVPEVGDHGNSYFKTDSSNGTSSSTRGGNRRDSGGRGGGAIQHQHQQQRGRRGGAQGASKPQQSPHNPGFFHDDRFDAPKTDENGINDPAPQKTNDGKQQTEGHKKFPPRNNNPRKPATMNKSFENDKNQNDSNKPNMNVSNGFGQRQDRRGGGTQHPSRNNLNNQHSRRGALTGGASGVRHPPQQQNGVNGINGNQNGSKDFEIQRKSAPKIDGNKTQNVKDPNFDKQRSVPSNRGRYFKSFGKPSNYSNPRQNKVSSQKPKPTNNNNNNSNNNGISKPQNPKLDKDGQAVKRLIDNIIDQVVRHERKEQKKNGEGEGEEENDVKQENQNNGISESENHGNENSNEEKKNEEKSEEKEKPENVEKEEKKEESLNENENNQSENRVESNNAESSAPEGNNNESKPAKTASAESKEDESHAENVQEQKSEEQPKTAETHSENQPKP